VAHTATSDHHTEASQTLGRAAAEVPQRTIVIRADPAGDPEMTSWISANCHLVGGGKQVCSEEIAIVAGGDRIHRVPPLVSALLIPDMPVAVWWLGDLPNEHEDYVEALLRPADRLIVDSVHFDSPADLALITRVAQQTTTAPADLNWVRLEEWRVATASIFDPPAMRGRLSSIRRVRVVAGASEEIYFGQMIEALFFASWLGSQAGHRVDADGRVEGAAGAIDYSFERRVQTEDVGGVSQAEILFDDGTTATITRQHDRGVLTANVGGVETTPESVTRSLACRPEDLIVRHLKRPEADRVFRKALPFAARLAKRISQ
ncbi:MAG TPA: glucose-6-phosphate dehydrogenase assembly protein OpcA, partial [Thermoanaerobaculia bacterium]|nr:glucose-6-phosphate dehydrogenase assembly protein OpcA [Thermoanaerobaculia bacterium]